MKKSLLLSLIFCSHLVFATPSYESQIDHFWNKTVQKHRAGWIITGYLPKDVKTFLQESSEEMAEGERLLVSFYPKKF